MPSIYLHVAGELAFIVALALGDPTTVSHGGGATVVPTVASDGEEPTVGEIADLALSILCVAMILLCYGWSCRSLSIERSFDTLGRDLDRTGVATARDHRKRRMRKLLDDGGIPAIKFHSDLSTGVDTCCSICLCEMDSTSVVRKLRCNHLFHADCIDPWLISNQTCPLCKDDVLVSAGSEDNSCSQTPSSSQSQNTSFSSLI